MLVREAAGAVAVDLAFAVDVAARGSEDASAILAMWGESRRISAGATPVLSRMVFRRRMTAVFEERRRSATCAALRPSIQ